MEPADNHRSGTRMIAMGSRPLMEGFQLLGMETFTDATADTAEKVIKEIHERNQKALILLESYLAKSDIKIISQLRSSGGKIIITEIPALNKSEQYHPEVEELVKQTLGNQALKDDL